MPPTLPPGRRGLAGALPRLALGAVSERGLDREAGDGAGLGARAAGLAQVDAGCCVRVLRVRRFCVGYGIPSPTQTRSASTREGSIVAAVCRGKSQDRIRAQKVEDPPPARAYAEPWPEDAETKNHASPTGPSQTPRPEATPRGRCRSGPSRRPDPAKAEAAHQQGHDPRRQRTSSARQNLSPSAAGARTRRGSPSTPRATRATPTPCGWRRRSRARGWC